jgi:hypothetical protein
MPAGVSVSQKSVLLLCQILENVDLAEEKKELFWLKVHSGWLHFHQACCKVEHHSGRMGWKTTAHLIASRKQRETERERD